ncbi:tetratricopeptide repeat protein [Streptomyces exfoliatus]|uniref:Tetratricopeptide repeat protein n=1 Tax=Streptomyces exfoliatus TaxID=1905 RepID=A0ABV3CSB3_STREX
MSAEQHISVTGGFGYGVIGADIHVFGDGTPVYLLENYRPAPPPDSAWLRELPSRMLQARHAVVTFTGRERELASLDEWLRAGPRLAVRWLYGPGGAGKTRLAERFAQQCLTAGWKVLTATHGPGSVLPAPGSQDLRPDGHSGLLLIVDYADRWPLSHLTWLLSNRLLHRSQTPTRVLLLARSADAWPAVRAGLARHQAGTSGQPLEPLDHRTGARDAMFNAARNGFSAYYALADPASVRPPGPLDVPGLGLVLAIQMAALVAVDAHATGRRAPSDPAGLTIYLLDRENLHWHQLYGDGTGRLGAADQGYATPPGAMNRTVFTAALTGALPPDNAAAVLAPLRFTDDTERLLADHALCYPPSAPDRPSALEPLYPDRLAEDFLALTVPGHDTDYPGRPWAADIAGALLTRTGRSSGPSPDPDPSHGHGSGHDPGASAAAVDGATPSADAAAPPPPPWTPRAVTMLAVAAERWPHLGPAQLHPLLRADPALAVAAGSAALVALASPPDVPMDLLVDIAAHFPPERDVDLDVGIARVVQRLAAYLLPRTTDRGHQSSLLHELGDRLSNAGLRTEALAARQRLVEVDRLLADEDPERELVSLAGSLIALGKAHVAVGALEEALVPTAEAVALWRRLLREERSHDPVRLATPLLNLSGQLSALGRHAQALAAAEEAVALIRRSPSPSGSGPAPELPLALRNLSISLSRLGRRDEALAASEEAVAGHRLLADAAPAEALPPLAGSLSNHAVRLSEVGRWEQAEQATGEAVTLLRPLATSNPDAFAGDLADALQGRAVILGRLGRRGESLEAVGESVDIHRRLAHAHPAVGEPKLAFSLNSLSLRLAELGDLPRALAVAEEAVAVHRRLAAGNPAAFEDGLAAALNNLGGRLHRLGRFPDALAAAQEAVAIRRRMVSADPAVHRHALAAALTGLANRLNAVDRNAEASAAAEEAVALLRVLAEEDFTVHGPQLAAVLGNLGLVYASADRPSEALSAGEEALRIRRRLVEVRPAAFEPGLAAALLKYGIALSASGDALGAVAAAEESVAIRRRLAAAEPSAFERDLAAALVVCASARFDAGRPVDALAAGEEALACYVRLAADQPKVYEVLVAETGALVAQLLDESGRHADAEALRARLAVRTRVGLRERLALRRPNAAVRRLAGLFTRLVRPRQP